jgi:hypothetical protein
MEVIAAIAVLWALCLLSLVFALPHHFFSAGEQDNETTKQAPE